MAGSILLHLKDYSEQVSLVLNVPGDFSASQLLLEVIEACKLKCMDNQGQPIRYVLQRQRDNAFLPPHGALNRFRILYGETLYLSRMVAPEQLQPQRPPVSGKIPALYPPEVYRLQAAGRYEQALLTLLERWESFERLENTTGDGVVNMGRDDTAAGKENLRPGIEILARELVDEQLRSTDFDEFYNVVEAPAARRYFEVYPDFRQRFVGMMLDGSYRLAQAFQYQAARDFAVLAVRLDPENEMAQNLESLAQQYVTLLATTDKEERLDLARAIYQADRRYGNIAEDLRLIIQSNRLGRPVPDTGVYGTPPLPALAAVNLPPGGPAWHEPGMGATGRS